MPANFLRDASVTQFGLFELRANLAAFFYLFVPLYTNPSTLPHIQGLDVQVTYKLSFSYYYFPFIVFAL